MFWQLFLQVAPPPEYVPSFDLNAATPDDLEMKYLDLDQDDGTNNEGLQEGKGENNGGVIEDEIDEDADRPKEESEDSKEGKKE